MWNDLQHKLEINMLQESNSTVKNALLQHSPNNYLKVVSAIFYFFTNDSPSETMKNAYYFI